MRTPGTTCERLGMLGASLSQITEMEDGMADRMSREALICVDGPSKMLIAVRLPRTLPGPCSMRSTSQLAHRGRLQVLRRLRGVP